MATNSTTTEVDVTATINRRTPCQPPPDIGRRHLLKRAAVAVALASFPIALRATPEKMRRAMRELLGSRPINEGRVTLEIPALAENGNSVAMTVRVDSPMDEHDHVKAIHLFAEKNPLPRVASYYLGPHCGRAQVASRIRLSDTQDITAVAHMSDDSLWSASTHTIVTLAACIDPYN